jgi:phosphoglycolate phosphatase-like HAD superfamily hydrolase
MSSGNGVHILLFDIDATLLLTGGAGKVAIEKTFEDVFGLEKVWRNIVPDGKTDPAIFDEIARKVFGRDLSSAEHARLTRAYYKYFPEALRRSKRFRLMPGVKKLLAQLSKMDDVHLGLATGNFEKTAWMKLAHGGIDHHFTFGGFACDSRDRSHLTRLAVLRGKRKVLPHQTIRNILIIGDSCHDVRAGRTAGAKTVAVLTGSTARRQILAEKPDYIFDDLSDSRAFLRLLTH